MSAALREFWASVLHLGSGTVHVFGRLFPQLLTLQLLGWLGYGVSLRLAASLSTLKVPWLVLLVFSTGFVLVLTAIVLQLRLVGDSLGVRRLLPEDAPSDDRDESVGRLLALTLLPFLGIYAAFGYVQKAAYQLVTASLTQTGFLGDPITSQLNPKNTREVITVVAVVVGAYVVRRTLDLVHEFTDRRVFGLLAGLVESFFMLSLILSGGHLVSAAKSWFGQRVVAQWLDGWLEGIVRVGAAIKVNIPQLLLKLSKAFDELLWPFLLDVVSKPIAWLAIAALIYGSHLLSVADLWRRGEPPGRAVQKLAQRDARRKAQKQGSGVGRRAWLEFQEVFLGDIDDKYVPTVQSVRLVLKAGVLFLAAFVLLHWVITVLEKLVLEGVVRLVGGHDNSFWYTWAPLLDLIGQVPLEPLRISLLGVTFAACLQRFHDLGEAAERGERQGASEELQPVEVTR